MSDSSNNGKPNIDKKAWNEIISDLLILSLISAAIGVGLYLAMKPFKRVSPSDAIYSTVTKGDRVAMKRASLETQLEALLKKIVAENKEIDEEEKKIDTAFDKEFEAGEEKYDDFINAQDENGITPLMRICYTNLLRSERTTDRDKTRLRFVEKLLKHPDIDVQIKDKHGFTALHWAAWSGFPLIAERLIEAGLDINQTEENGHSPLALAAMRGNNEVVAMLLSKGAKLDAKTKADKTVQELAKENAEAYAMRKSKFYTLIFAEEHLKAYDATEQLLNKSEITLSDEEKKAKEKKERLDAALKVVMNILLEEEEEKKEEKKEKVSEGDKPQEETK